MNVIDVITGYVMIDHINAIEIAKRDSFYVRVTRCFLCLLVKAVVRRCSSK